jgi:hypothetical protein
MARRRNPGIGSCCPLVAMAMPKTHTNLGWSLDGYEISHDYISIGSPVGSLRLWVWGENGFLIAHG